jgi:pyruvate dehydrogenase E2 component (dihydrolipoamide acetyltransferase)
MANIIDMPKLSDTMTVGTLVKWLKNEGDAVKAGDMLAEVETDKATMELECFFAGTLLKIFIPAGSQVEIGSPLCAIGKPGEKIDAPGAAPKAAAAAPATPAAAPAPAPAPAVGDATSPSRPSGDREVAAPAPAPVPASDGRIKISPLAKKLAAEKGLDPAGIAGSGPGGRIVRADVIAAEKAGAPSPVSRPLSPVASSPSPVASSPIPAEGKLVPVSNMRATIARRLVEAKSTIPHFYLDLEIDAAPLLELRAQLNAALEKDGVKLSVNDFILKAAAEALGRVPVVNCSWDPSGAIRHYGSVNVSFAVAIEDGLITPVIRNTGTKTLLAISTEAKALAKRAKEKKLAPAEFTGGTFCVTNLGMMGIDRFCAIINPPNAAILAVGATVKKPVVKNDQIGIGQRMNLTLSCDHRVVDGATGATYLAALKELLERPSLLLL